jgi:DNA-binding XRE family transcriptional regulator
VTYRQIAFKSLFPILHLLIRHLPNYLSMDIKIKIGNRIKELRIEKKLTQEELAWEADVDRTYMNHVENGRKNISIKSLEKIIKALDVSISEFFSTLK